MSTGYVIIGCIMALLILVYKSSAMTRYYLKFSIFFFYSLLCGVLTFPVMVLRPRYTRNVVYPTALFRPINKLLGFSYSFCGLENLDNSRGGVIIINHQSFLDMYSAGLILSLLDHGILAVIKSMLYVIPLGVGFWLCGSIFLDVSKTASAMDNINQQVETIRNKKGKLVLFPECLRNDTDMMLPFKKGAFHAAVAAQCPIQPIVISKYHFLDHKRKRFTSGKFVITVLPAIETEGLTKEDIPSLIKEAYNVMMENFTETSAKTRA